MYRSGKSLEVFVRATLSIIDENGNRYEGNIQLSLADKSQLVAQDEGSAAGATPSTIDFSLPVRAFVRTHAAGNSSGAARFTVLVAFLLKGAENADVPGETLRVEWSRLTAHLGAFNRAHSTRAKDRAWVDSPAPGLYRLGPRWREAFGSR
jgi:hypothetical protein